MAADHPDRTPDWSDEEKPTMAGSPSRPWHSPWTRVAYACVAVLVGITGGLGNALLSANLPTIQGQLGLTPAEGAWLPAAYVMVNVSSNLLVFKFRQQYGMRVFTEIGLGVYVLLTLLHLAFGGYETTLMVRAASGLAGATCNTLAMQYMLQAAPPAYAGKMLVVGVSISQLAMPLAWLLSPTLLEFGQWHNLYLFEAGLALCAFAAVVVLKLPPGIQIKAFERADFLTFALVAPAVAMIVAVLAQGYAHWWLNAPWLAWLLIAAIVLLTLAFLVEHHRANPLIQTRWLMSSATLRFIIGSLLIRFLTSEQTYGAVAMLRSLGMGPDQMQPLFLVIMAGTIVGTAISALVFSPKTVGPQILASIALFWVASTIDFGRTSMDRPQDFFFSQFLMAVGSGMFMGPLILIGVMQAMKHGADHIVSFAVILSMTQTFGGFLGSAAFGSYQFHREHIYSAGITAHVDPTNGVVAQRLRLQQQIYGATITDPMLREAQGMAQLAQAARREANTRAYSDMFALIGLIALLFLFWMLAATYVARRKGIELIPSTPAPDSAANS